ncbi:ABC transporter ATP-binding protein [Trinickia mobilis]|uniref:ABC transporter ATP-binding protein n=1 Tax=Trinickia mobilis TaxID=2816356 RepID=UPI001A8DF793|nr:ABC transporter ATP-binding protein [Trinickia mobilis]
MAPLLALRSVSKRFGKFVAVDDVSLDVFRGDFLTLLGPSGSGKTTLLMMIAGFATPTSGDIFSGGENITSVPPEHRNFGMVLQGYALFPHLSVFDNVAFPLKVRGRSRSEIQDKVKRVLDMVQLTQLSARMPRELSGGQQQRVAIARALAFEPDLLLLDEPLSALDKKLRAEVQQELRDLHKRLGTTFICVTHDQDEALSLSDRIAIMRDGRLQQVGSPKELYDAPRSRFVADFLGRSNFLDADVVETLDDGFIYQCHGRAFVQRHTGAMPKAGDKALIALRPENIDVAWGKNQVENQNFVEGQIVSTSYGGSHETMAVNTEIGQDLWVSVPKRQRSGSVAIGESVWLSWGADSTVRVSDG